MRILRILNLFIVLGLVNSAFAESKDTTFSANLYTSKKSNIKISFEYEPNRNFFDGKFNMIIDGINIYDSCYAAFDAFELKIVDVDKSDNYRELAIVTADASEFEYSIFRFSGNKIIKLGYIITTDEPIFNGDGRISGTEWMGFWMCDFEFVLNKNKKEFEPVFKDEYPMKYYENYKGEIKVNEDFETYEKRDKKSDVSVKFKAGDKLEILKAYIKTDCDEGYKVLCYWYLLKDKNGKTGWLQLIDFQEKVEGIPWAG